jgi:hypothetical protein
MNLKVEGPCVDLQHSLLLCPQVSTCFREWRGDLLDADMAGYNFVSLTNPLKRQLQLIPFTLMLNLKA